jgi:hypothetical protein
MNLPRDIVVGTIGSILAAIVIYGAQVGFRFSKKSSEAAAARLQREKEIWKTRELAKRQTITNRYLFEILRYFLLANIVISAPSVAFALAPILVHSFEALSWVSAIASAVGMIYFYLSLGRLLRYVDIRRSDPDETQ